MYLFPGNVLVSIKFRRHDIAFKVFITSYLLKQKFFSNATVRLYFLQIITEL